MDFPIHEDPDMDVVRGLVPSGSFSLPNYTILDRSMTIVERYMLGHTNALAAADELMDDEIPDHSDDWPMPDDIDLSALPDEPVDEGDEPSLAAEPFSVGPSEGAPFGGSSCTFAPATGGAGLSLLLGLFGAAGVVRRRR